MACLQNDCVGERGRVGRVWGDYGVGDYHFGSVPHLHSTYWGDKFRWVDCKKRKSKP